MAGNREDLSGDAGTSLITVNKHKLEREKRWKPSPVPQGLDSFFRRYPKEHKKGLEILAPKIFPKEAVI